MMKPYYKYWLPAILLLFCFSTEIKAQIPVTPNLVYTQNFDGFTAAGAATLPFGWSASGSFTYRGTGNGSSNSGGSWAYGNAPDRSLGYLGSGTSSSINYSVSFVNNTGGPLTQLNIGYDFEQWRFAGGNTNGWTVTGTGALAATSLSALNTNSTGAGTTGIVSVTPKAIVLTGLNIAPGAAFGITWHCQDGAGNDNGIAIDNFQMTAPCSPSAPVFIDTTLCAGAVFTLGGIDYTTPQVIPDTFQNASGCDSVVSYNLAFLAPIVHSFADTICYGASYSWGAQNINTTGSYTQVFASAAHCDSTVTLHLFVRPQISHTVADTLCYGGTYIWGVQSLTAGGTFSQVFSAVTGCDSAVTLHLFVRPQITHDFADTICYGATYSWGTQSLNAAGTFTQVFPSSVSCDSTVTLHLFVRPEITHAFADTICYGATYSWGTQSLNATGTFTQVFPSFVNCDSTVTLHLFVRPGITHTFADTICYGATYSWGTQSLNAAGTFTQVFPSSVSCDSTVTLHLFVRPQITHSFADTICYGATYAWGTQNLNTTGTFTQVFPAAISCDSTVTLHLFVRPQITHSFADTICYGASYTWGAQTLTATGVFTQVFPSAVNCDSTVTLHLFVRPQITHAATAVICSGSAYSFGPQTLHTAGTYSQVFTAASGCDSTVTLTLTVTPAITSAAAMTICNGASYSWGTQVLNAGGVYTQTFSTAGGCDSIVTLTLTISPAITSTVSATICNGDTYAFGAQVLTASGDYSHVFPSAAGCDSTVSLSLFVRPPIVNTIQRSICHGHTYSFGTQTLTDPGTYNEVFLSAAGCDSTVTLHLLVGDAPVYTTIDTAGCSAVLFEGHTYTASTSLTDTVFNSKGCDSAYRVVHISVYNTPPVQQVIDTAGCELVQYEHYSYQADTVLKYTYKNYLGCDSLLRTVRIKVLHPFSDTTMASICAGGSYSFHGQQYAATGTYKAAYAGVQGCDSDFVLQLQVNPLPSLTIDPPGSGGFCVGDSVELKVAASASYNLSWTDGYGVTTGEGPEARVYLLGYANLFTVTATDEYGCKDSSAITVSAQPCCNIWMPNAFSPNGDGRNDVFKPETSGHPREYVLYIFNRWGQTVFSTFEINVGWDGTLNGKPADVATYYYRISGKCVNGELLDRKGQLTLIR